MEILGYINSIAGKLLISVQELIDQRIAVRITTKEEFDDYMKKRNKNSYGGFSYHAWNYYTNSNSNDSIGITVGFYNNKQTEYTLQDYYENEGYEIVSYKDIIITDWS